MKKALLITALILTAVAFAVGLNPSESQQRPIPPCTPLPECIFGDIAQSAP
jgi:hypothetical protein